MFALAILNVIHMCESIVEEILTVEASLAIAICARDVVIAVFSTDDVSNIVHGQSKLIVVSGLLNANVMLPLRKHILNWIEKRTLGW